MAKTGDKLPKVDGDNPSEPERIRFTPSPQVWSYLGWLSRNTLLGKTEQEVAEHVLVQRLTEMRQEEYKDPKNA
jgi:hypothetical protein